MMLTEELQNEIEDMLINLNADKNQIEGIIMDMIVFARELDKNYKLHIFIKKWVKFKRDNGVVPHSVFDDY